MLADLMLADLVLVGAGIALISEAAVWKGTR
jgi:hypothetical protein